jgi:hypothetical protein
MIQYIYIVKCPDCDDEHFDFFDEAKALAMDYAGAHPGKCPYITQVEVDRNDFGECTSSCDLGTVWSWEEACGMADKNPESVFSKADLCADCEDPEFAALDNDFRKPIPSGMTLEQLVEEMEENEDVVECRWCDELFDKSECRYEVDLGWLCHQCIAAIESRGEPLTFREGPFEESVNRGVEALTEHTSDEDGIVWCCEFDGRYIGTVVAAYEEEAVEKMFDTYPQYPYGMYDGCYEVYPEDDTELAEDASKQYKVVKIVDCFGHELPIDKMEFTWVGKDSAFGHYKGYGFDKMYSKADLYTVITEPVSRLEEDVDQQAQPQDQQPQQTQQPQQQPQQAQEPAQPDNNQKLDAIDKKLDTVTAELTKVKQAVEDSKEDLMNYSADGRTQTMRKVTSIARALSDNDQMIYDAIVNDDDGDVQTIKKK